MNEETYEWFQAVFAWMRRLHENDQTVVNLLRESNQKADRNHQQGERIMAAIDNLNANTAKLTSDVAALTTSVDTLFARPAPAAGVPEAEVQAAADAVAVANTSVTDLTAKVDAVVNPPPPPAAP
jgi:Tfp pilus assembly protein PilW